MPVAIGRNAHIASNMCGKPPGSVKKEGRLITFTPRFFVGGRAGSRPDLEAGKGGGNRERYFSGNI